MSTTPHVDGVRLSGVPSEQLKSKVLNTVYEVQGFKKMDGFDFLAAVHRTTKVGIFVVDGNFSRDHFKRAIAEARAAGLRTQRIYVYGQTATYSGNGICFCKFDEIGLVAAACTDTLTQCNLNVITPKTTSVATICKPHTPLVFLTTITVITELTDKEQARKWMVELEALYNAHYADPEPTWTRDDAHDFDRDALVELQELCDANSQFPLVPDLITCFRDPLWRNQYMAI